MKTLAYALAVFVAVLLTYLPSVKYEFVTYDDHDYVYLNPHVMTGLSNSNLVWAVTSCGYANNWHPLTWLSLQLDATLQKERPGFQGLYPDDSLRRLSSVMHGHNAALHAANAALLFILCCLLVTRVIRRDDAPAATDFIFSALFSLLWAIHPLRAEVVCWVSERKELLSVFFMLLSLVCYIAPRRAPAPGALHLHLHLHSPLHLLLSLVFFALALLAKPVAVTLPVVLFAFDWAVCRRSFLQSLARTAPFFALAVGAGILTLIAQVEAVDVGRQYSALERVVMSLSAPAIYLRQTFWPVGLSAFYPQKPPVPWPELWVGSALFAGSAGVCLAWLRWRRSRILAVLVFAVAWCLVSLVPMLGVVKVGDQPHSDRYTYWIGCGCAAVAALFVCRYALSRARETAAALAVALAALFFATTLRVPVWRNAMALYRDGVPKSWAEQPVCALSQLLRRQGEKGEREAERMLRTALSRTGYRDIRAEFAHLLAVRSRNSPIVFGDEDPAFAEARLEAGIILAADPNHWLANESLAIVEAKEGKFESALKRLEIARREGVFTDRIDSEIALCRKHLAAKGTKK